jgi:hypothetical protein
MFMTARVERSQEEEYLKLGAARTIQKPSNPSTLADEVRTAWERSPDCNVTEP